MTLPLEADVMASTTIQVSMGRVRTGWILSGLLAAFMVFDAVGKIAKPIQVVEAFARTGWPLELAAPIGIILLVCTAVYLIPRTSIIGAILLTGYLGGAVATNVRVENPLFTHTLFPVYFGVLIWFALWLRESRLRALLPLLK